MQSSRKRKLSVTSQGTSSKQPRIDSPIVISDDSDDDARQISPPPLTAKQKGKGRAVPETVDPPPRLRDIDVISISDDEAPISPALSCPQTPLEVLKHQFSPSVKETSNEFEASSEALPPDQILEQFKDLFFGERQCSRCEKSIQPARSPRMSTDLQNIAELLHVVCADCKTNHCRGCMSPVQCASSCGQGDECDTVKCCAHVRVIAIFEILAVLDHHRLKELSYSQKRGSKTGTKALKKKPSTVGPGGTGYANGRLQADEYDSYDDEVSLGDQNGLNSDNWGHLGWGWGQSGTFPAPSNLIPWGASWDALADSELSYTQQAVTKPKRSKKPNRRGTRTTETRTRNDAASGETHNCDEVSTRVFHALAVYLPNPYADSPEPFDFVPHPSIYALLQLSYLPETLAALLRNDSVADWIARSETYQTMLRLLRQLADCELTIRLLVSQGWSKSESCGIVSFIRGDGVVVWEKDEEGGIIRTAPLYTYFKKLTKQSEAYLTGMSSITGDIGETGIKEMSLCGDIIAAKEDLDRCLAIIGDASDPDEMKANDQAGGGSSNSEELDKRYERECADLAFEHVTLSEDGPTGGLVYRTFRYRDMVEASSNDTRVPKDRLHILKELAVMGTALPPGIWVRVDEVRNDVIKVMIAGPENTPYTGGLFEFDCFLPMQYPNVPPLMTLCTTGEGRVRFNPNLYNCGKVCLSLLGTWSGSAEEKWQPRKSTLLQVLVSIQSMILVETPYFNEPGHGHANPKRRESISYNRNICLQTVRWAIVEWLDDAHINGLWGDVIRSHFSLKHERVRSYINAWAKDNPSVLNYAPSSTRGDAVASRPPRKHRGRALAASAGVDLLAEYDRRIHRLLQPTSGSTLGVASGPGKLTLGV